METTKKSTAPKPLKKRVAKKAPTGGVKLGGKPALKTKKPVVATTTTAKRPAYKAPDYSSKLEKMMDKEQKPKTNSSEEKKPKIASKVTKPVVKKASSKSKSKSKDKASLGVKKAPIAKKTVSKPKSTEISKVRKLAVKSTTKPAIVKKKSEDKKEGVKKPKVGLGLKKKTVGVKKTTTGVKKVVKKKVDA